MGYADWRIRGPAISTCNCDWGCPCQFNGHPTHGNCRAAYAMRIDEGHFGDVPLDGLLWCNLLAWPGPIYEGNGEALLIVDQHADKAQVDALFTILSGKETEPGATIFSVFRDTLATIHKPLFKPIAFEVDIAARNGRFAVEGVVETEIEPLKNPVTGVPLRARVLLPEGFEYREAEFASGRARAEGPIPLNWTRGHSHVFIMDMTPQGPA